MVTLDLKLSRLGHSVSLALNLCSTTQPSCSPHDPITVQTPLAALALSVLRRLANFSVWPLSHLATPALGRYVALLLWRSAVLFGISALHCSVIPMLGHFRVRPFYQLLTPVCPVHGSDASAYPALGLFILAASGTRSAARPIHYRSSARPLFRSANLFQCSDASPVQCTAFRCFGCSCARLPVLGLYSVGLLRRFVVPALDSSMIVGQNRRFLFISIHLLLMLFCSLLL